MSNVLVVHLRAMDYLVASDLQEHMPREKIHLNYYLTWIYKIEGK